MPAGVSTLFDANVRLTRAAAHLMELLKAKARLRASLDTELVADGLRRYRKFAKPPAIAGHHAAAAAGQASSRAKQSSIAVAFVLEAGIDEPARVALEVFIDRWIDANVSLDAAVPTRKKTPGGASHPAFSILL